MRSQRRYLGLRRKANIQASHKQVKGESNIFSSGRPAGLHLKGGTEYEPHVSLALAYRPAREPFRLSIVSAPLASLNIRRSKDPCCSLAQLRKYIVITRYP